MAVLFFREVFAGFGEGGTAAVEAIGVVYTFAAGLLKSDCQLGPLKKLGMGGADTVCSSQLIHLGIIIAVNVRAQAVNPDQQLMLH